MKPVRVLLADDHVLVRAGFRSLMQGLPNVEVIAEASDGRTAVDLAEKYLPDLVLMDISMPFLNGIDATQRLVKLGANIKVIILSIYANEEYVWQALRSGASGYLLKDAEPAQLELAINSVLRGEIYLSPAVSKNVVHDYLRNTGRGYSQLEKLTPRQREILQMIAEGNSTKDIADKLQISAKTALTHRAQIMDRLEIQDVVGLVRYAMRAGLIPPN